jgi:ABC-2 type transport system ATP-binding protein
MKMIETVNLTKSYGTLEALVDLNLKIGAGDIFGFIGPNGAGKTTTMRILATLLEPTRGQAFVDGKNVQKQGKEVRRTVGYMPDFMGVYDDLKVFEYLEFFAAAFDIAPKERKPIVEGVLELTDLQSKKAAAVDSLSRGMQQRLGLARVLIHELEEICDYVGIIEHGRLVFSGTLEEIWRKLGTHSKVRVTVVPEHRQRAAEILGSIPAITEVIDHTSHLLVNFTDGQLAGNIVAKALVAANIDIISIEPERMKLDDAFLQLTKGIVH